MLYNTFFFECKVNKFFAMAKCFAAKKMSVPRTSRPGIYLQYDMGSAPVPAHRPYRIVELYCLYSHSLGIRTTAISTMLPVLLS